VETEPLHKREQRSGMGIGLRYDICRVIRRGEEGRFPRAWCAISIVHLPDELRYES